MDKSSGPLVVGGLPDPGMEYVSFFYFEISDDSWKPASVWQDGITAEYA